MHRDERHACTSPARPPSPPPRRARSQRTGAIRVAVVGATGYAGGELVRWLAGHPAVIHRRASSAATGTRNRSARSRPHLARDGAARRSRRCPKSDAVFLALPHGQAAAGRARPRRGGPGGHRPGRRLPPARRGRLPALVPLRPSRAGPPGDRRLRPARAAPRRAGRGRRRGRADRRRARLLRHGHHPGPGPAGARGPPRRRRRRRQERRLGRGTRAAARPDLRRGQRERHAPTASTATATSPRWSRSWRRSAAGGGHAEPAPVDLRAPPRAR